MILKFDKLSDTLRDFQIKISLPQFVTKFCFQEIEKQLKIVDMSECIIIGNIWIIQLLLNITWIFKISNNT